jgi:micrococcal nuclease
VVGKDESPYLSVAVAIYDVAMKSVFLSIALIFIAASAYAAGAWTGLVEYVVDGDTLHVRPIGGGPLRHVRLEGLDAPEICQPWGPQARQALAQHVLHHRVQVQSRAQDGYGRLVARVRVKGVDAGARMVAQGNAWSYRWHARQGRYDRQEVAARVQGRGLFASGNAEKPGDFRRRHGSCYPGR